MMAAQNKPSKTRDRDHDKLELWVVKLTGANNYRTWKDQMENFLRTKEGLLKLVRGESEEPEAPAIPNIFKDDQLAFEDHLRAELRRLPPTRELDMRFKTYQRSWERYETETKTHDEQNRSACDYLYRSMNKTCRSQILGIDNAKGIWDKLNILYKTTDVSPIIDLHHQLATVEFNPRNPNAYTERIKRIANEIKELGGDSQDFTNTLRIVERIPSDQTQLLSQIRSLSLAEFTIEKVTSLIHAQQVANPNSQDPRPSAGLTVAGAGRKRRANKQLQKSKDNENRCSNCGKIGHLEPSCWFNHPEKAPAWWDPQRKEPNTNTNTQRQARMTVQLPDRSAQQLQITDRPYTETGQQPQQERAYLTGANTVYRAQSDSNNSENFRSY